MKKAITIPDLKSDRIDFLYCHESLDYPIEEGEPGITPKDRTDTSTEKLNTFIPANITANLRKILLMMMSEIGLADELPLVTRKDNVSSKAVPNVLEALYDLPHKPASALKADRYGDTPLSETLEDGDIEEVKKLIMAKDSPLTDAELLTNIGIAVTDAEIRDKLGIDKKTASNIFNGSLYQLTLLGEDISELMDSYTIGEFSL
ncbi:MAG: hypothetical protein J0L79_04470 [Rickettsiales bacterium]|nr:hypothetical protein [Rickettsiales bacterium]MCA0253949.1 hypothetical protein [Pseudomonadota bacterium]